MVSTEEIWLTDFGDPYPGEPASHRPAVVLGPAAIFGDGLPFVIVAPLTTTDRRLSLHVEVEANEGSGLDETSWVQCELIRSINAGRLIHRLGRIDAATRRAVRETVATLLDL